MCSWKAETHTDKQQRKSWKAGAYPTEKLEWITMSQDGKQGLLKFFDIIHSKNSQHKFVDTSTPRSHT